MHRIKRWFNQHRKKIVRIIGIPVAVIVVVQLLQWGNTLINNSEQKKLATGQNNKSELNTIRLEDDISTVTGQSLSKTQKTIVQVIDEFIEFCNNKQINEAYNLLSEECKSQMYPTVANFQQNYYNYIFAGSAKNISAENWIGNIYKVKYKEDALSTGIYNSENTIQDYITGVRDEENNIKLNINGYIRKEEINKEKEVNKIKINIVEKHQYMNFETYVFEITNNSDNTILLNDIKSEDIANQKSMYLEDRNNIKYTAYIHELSEPEMKILPGETRRISIKYYNKYSSSKDIEKIVFSRIILNYDIYQNINNIGNYNNYGTIQINL